MTLRRGLALRTLGVSLVLGLCATLVLMSIAASWGGEVALGRSVRVVSEQLLAAHGAACRASQEGWSRELSEGVVVEAFDAAGKGGPGVARPDPALLARLERGERQPSQLYFPLLDGRPWAGAMLVRAAHAGPCSLLEFRWKRTPERLTGALSLFLAAALVTALAAALSAALVTGPLLRRLKRLHRAAGTIGGTAYAPAEDAAVDELGELSQVLDTTHARILADAARLKAQAHALERHLSDVAHDLKTPLSSLQLALELATGAPEEDLHALLLQGIEDTVYLTALVDNLRLATQLGEGVDPLEGEPRVELGQLVERVVRRLRLLARRKDLSLEAARPDAGVWVRCHPTMMEQAISNLVHNALTYGERGGHVVAIVEAVGPERFRLTVLDDGPGVSPAELERLGERLFRAPQARRREPRGSGLGVAIVRELCRRTGLALSFESNAPRGLKVCIEGPQVAGVPGASAEASATAAGSGTAAPAAP